MYPSRDTAVDEVPTRVGTKSLTLQGSLVLLFISLCHCGCFSNPFASRDGLTDLGYERVNQGRTADRSTIDSPVIHVSTRKPAVPHTEKIRQLASTTEKRITPFQVTPIQTVSRCASCATPSPIAPTPCFAIQPESVLFGPTCRECGPVMEPCRLNFCDDLNNIPNRVANETVALFTWENAIFLGAATGVTLAIRDNVDARVAQDNAQNGPRWNNVSEVFSHGGDAFLVHAPLLIGMYTISLCQQNDDLHDLTLTMATSYKVTVVSALALQYITGTRTTSNSIGNIFKDSGFPSEPTAASFALAAVIDERFGGRADFPPICSRG